MPFYNSTFGCFDDVKQCLDTICCPCCQVGRQCAALEGNANTHNCMWCCATLCVGGFMPMCLRCKVSDKYQLEESAVTSCLCGICCGGCSLCMTGRELNFLGTNPGGFLCSPEDASKNMQ